MTIASSFVEAEELEKDTTYYQQTLIETRIRKILSDKHKHYCLSIYGLEVHHTFFTISAVAAEFGLSLPGSTLFSEASPNHITIL
ncbi:hypothetical protein J6590_013576 [Homalodisca vitripennis]|nr:hypothetical protein J6590_013576 [Homalodisca vitripennis]